MDAKIINAIGIALTTIGTIFTLWTVLQTNPKIVGTWKESKSRNKDFKEEQKKAKIGCCLIVFGGVMQIAGQFA